MFSGGIKKERLNIFLVKSKAFSDQLSPKPLRYNKHLNNADIENMFLDVITFSIYKNNRTLRQRSNKLCRKYQSTKISFVLIKMPLVSKNLFEALKVCY